MVRILLPFLQVEYNLGKTAPNTPQNLWWTNCLVKDKKTILLWFAVSKFLSRLLRRFVHLLF
jgi:hypothetical protein